MLQNISQCDLENFTSHQRVDACARASFKLVDGRTRIDRLYQHASAKIRFPKVHGEVLEAVLINTAGGLTGGDKLNWDLHLGQGAQVTTSTQACEKAYASSFGVAEVATKITLSEEARLNWLPQETILYNDSSLSRQFDVQLAPTACLLAVESLVLGRDAMGEVPQNIAFRDKWRVERGEKLIFADNLMLNEHSNANAQMASNQAVSTILFLAPIDDEQLQGLARRLNELTNAPLAAFSAKSGKLTGRIIAQNSYELRKLLLPVLEILNAGSLPKVWRI